MLHELLYINIIGIVFSMNPMGLGNSYSPSNVSKQGSIAVLVSMMLLAGFSASFYMSGVQTSGIATFAAQTTNMMVVQTSVWTHATTAQLTQAFNGGTFGDAKQLLGTAISLTIIAVGIIGLFMNATGLLVNGDASHDPVITGAGASLLSTTLVGLIVAAGIIFLILRAFGVF